MSSAGGSITIELDSKLAERISNEHYSLQLDPPITIPYLSKPRARLCAFSFLNSFTNTDTQSDNNTVKLAWKAHSDTDWDTPYDDLPWKYTEFAIPNSFQDPAQLEVTIAKKIHELSDNGAPGAAFGTNLWSTMERLVQCKPGWWQPDAKYRTIASDGTRPDGLVLGPYYHTTARGFYYSDKSTASVVQTAAINAFPKARHDGTTILVPIDMVKPGTPHTPADSVHSAGTVDGLDLLETQRVEYKGSQNHRDAAPEWLIGSELLMVQDPFDDTGSFTNTDGGTFAGYKDVTSSVYLTQGARVVGVHKSADTSRYPLGFHYNGWEVSDGNPDARFNATHAIELEVTAEFRARYVKLFDNTYDTAYGHYPANADPTATPPHNGWTGLASLNTAHTGLPFIKTTDFGADTKGAKQQRIRNGIMEKKTQYVFTFTVPGYPTKLNNQVQDVHLSQSARDTAKATIKGYKTGEPAYRAYGAGRLASPDISDTGWGSSITAAELKSVALQEINPATIYSKHPNNLVIGTGAAENDEQWDRSVRPINFVADPEHADRLSFIAAWPGLYVCKESTLFTKLLGFSEDDLCTSTGTGPTKVEMAKQNPFMSSDGSVADAKDRTLIQANPQKTDILTVRSLQFHCPTVAPPSYMPNGKMVGAQLASVPVDVAPNQLQNWAATYDNSVPIDSHGQQINNLEFYITNQDQQVQDMQGTNFNATVQIEWPDPAPPHLGEAGAETMIQDVSFYRR